MDDFAYIVALSLVVSLSATAIGTVRNFVRGWA